MSDWQCFACKQSFDFEDESPVREGDNRYGRWYLCWACRDEWREQKRQEAASDLHNRVPDVEVFIPFLDELIWLCHPDHHPASRFEEANAATVFLLELKRSHTRTKKKSA